MTLRAELQEKPRPNPWTRRWQACSVLAVANMARGILWPLRGWDVLTAVVLLTALVGCCAMHIRTGRAIRAAQEDARLKAREAAAALRTPRAPDAGPDQCPVCAGYGLDALAKDDKFMERGALAKVVAWGTRRAHWDCAEFVPNIDPPVKPRPRTTDPADRGADRLYLDREIEPGYARIGDGFGTLTVNIMYPVRRSGSRWVASFIDPLPRRVAGGARLVHVGSAPEEPPHFEPFEIDGHTTYCGCGRCESFNYPGAYSRCRFCGRYEFAATKEVAAGRLILHAKECPKRPRPTMREIKAGFDEVDARMADLDTRIAAAASHVSFAEALHRLGRDC